MTPPYDIPAPAAGLIIAVLATAIAYLACVDWVHQDAHHNHPEK